MERASFSIREAKLEDSETLASIHVKAFHDFNESVSIPGETDFQSVETIAELFRSMIRGVSKVFSVAAVDNATGQLLGGAFLHHDSEVYSVGPISVDPDMSNKGVGKAMMTSLINKAKGEGAVSIRLMQVAANTKSFCLYAGLNFDARECYAAFRGIALPEKVAAASSTLGFTSSPNTDVRVMQPADVGQCAELFKKVMGYDRTRDINASLGASSWVLCSESRILAYTTGLKLFGHTVAQSEEDFVTLYTGMISKGTQQEDVLNISSRQCPRLVRWALASGLTLTRHRWYMVIGEYQSPDDFVYIPNILH